MGSKIAFHDISNLLDSVNDNLVQVSEEMWEQDWAVSGRNRWAELREKGGEVDACWIDGERPSASRRFGPVDRYSESSP